MSNDTLGHRRQIGPCRHMERWVEALADGSLRGLALWYTRLHVAGCHRCQGALAALEALVEQLRGLRTADRPNVPRTLSPSRESALHSAMDEVDRERG